MKRLALLALLLPSIVMAEALTWLKKDNPNELFIIAYASSTCSMTDEKLKSVVKGVLVRSRITPAPTRDLNGVNLEVFLYCMMLDSGNNPVFNLDIQFKKIVGPNDDGEYVRLSTNRNYGTLGIGDSDFMVQAIKNATENAITVYLESNFDLGDD